jgi:CRISPR-associated endonuclease/helicase Cas3
MLSAARKVSITKFKRQYSSFRAEFFVRRCAQMSMNLARIFKYWGKAQPELASSADWHPLAFHSLDVAAVAWVMLDRHPWLLKLFADYLNLQHEQAKRVIVLLILLHDVGKFAENFQWMRADLAAAAELTPSNGTTRHDHVGAVFLLKLINAPRDERDRVRERLGRWLVDLCGGVDAARALTNASCSHHGVPCQPEGDSPWQISDESQDTVLAFIGWAFEHFELVQLAEQRSARKANHVGFVTWVFAGFAIYCDWLGSDTRWFDYVDATSVNGSTAAQQLETYWVLHAQTKARKAVDQSLSADQPVKDILIETLIGVQCSASCWMSRSLPTSGSS